ncbi:MAG: hypothetical protein FWC75_02810 [Oscillospiraceae bacterium]|nr:hypothetical protein [Oscillospiraceae bacterium]
MGKIFGKDKDRDAILNTSIKSKHTAHEEPTQTLDPFSHQELWAKSTLPPDTEDLYPIFVISPGEYLTNETIRHRMWLHDLFDDEGIPYYIEVRTQPGSRLLNEAQHIFIEKRHAMRAIALINEFRNPKSIVKQQVTDGNSIMQKQCHACGKDIDFDYHKCPHCKAYV